MEQVKVLFVCMGNICRSPTAEGVFTKLVRERRLEAQFKIDSAGTHAYHIGDAPDLRSQKAALERGVELGHLRARKFTLGDFSDFDLVLAMDVNNFVLLSQACPDEHQNKVQYLLDYAPHLKLREVPDPYYGDGYGFERVLDLVEAAAEGLLKNLVETGRIITHKPH
jgi:protein-tyrosine phosphatase